MRRLPPWVEPVGLAMHVGVGAALTFLFTLLGASPVLAFAAVYAVAVAHEIGDGDLKRGSQGNPLGGWPWGGLLDVAAFLPVPFLYMVLA